MKIFNVNNAQETKQIGTQLAYLLSAGDLLLLDGDLGAGKTTFTKGLAIGLGVTRTIKSPTFTIIREYQGGKFPLYHMDVYRLENGGGNELGLEEYFMSGGISVVEWSNFISDVLPKNYLKISFSRDDKHLDSTTRTITMEATNNHDQHILEQRDE